MIWRLFFYIVVLLTAATGPVWIFAPTALVYILRYTGAEILFITFLVDAYFGYGHTLVPWYSVSTFCLLITVRLLRPYISVYTR
ncbi:MAG: hypothetical protein AUK16_00315 [Parcubacteria group bacterium CG2_30_44_11]|nr:MAG: hypothetical protein AUK16_00315 [Parcubacteria group bacterium CG2_30_44_11]